MQQNNTIVNFISRREIDTNVCRNLQKKLHVTENLINRLGLEKELQGHSGCVNCLEWDSRGRYLASASDDFQVIVWDPFLHRKVEVVPTGHHGNIFSVKFIPGSNDNTVVTGAGDNEVRVHNLVCKETTRVCLCHGGRVKRLATSIDIPDVFWSASEDGIVRQFDLRAKHTCMKNEKNVLVDLNFLGDYYAEAKCIAINPIRSELIAVGANDPYIRLYDRRMVKPAKGPPTCRKYSEDNLPANCVQYYVPGHIPCRKDLSERELRQYSATYVTFSPNGNELLVNLGSEQIYLFNINENKQSLLIRVTNKGREIVEPLKSYCGDGIQVDIGSLSKQHKPQMPENISSLKTLGNNMFERQQFSQSIRAYNQAIYLYPHNSVFYANRAAAYMKRDWCGDVYGALKDCLSSLRYDANNVKAYFRLTRCLLELSWPEEALACLNTFKSKFPAHASGIACAALEKDIKRKIKEFQDQSALKVQEDVPCEMIPREITWRGAAKDYDLRFYGHCNTTTDIKEANFFGSDGQFIVAGSDDGSIFIWDRKTTNSTRILKGDSSIVNCLQPHPSYCLLATSGIEHVVRLWSPRPEDGHENDLVIAEKDEVASSNQLRMQADPFDMVLMNMVTSNSQAGGSPATYNCRPS